MSGVRRWLFAAAGTAALAVLLIGALIGGAPGSPPPATALPTPVPPVTASPTQAASPAPTAVPTTATTVPLRVWFARDQLPPIAAVIPTAGGAGVDGRIAGRIFALMGGTAQTPPAGSTNPAALIRPHTGAGGTQVFPALSARIEGDTATVEFDIADWGVRGATMTEGLIQQLVYTITEEPAIRRARIVERGKTTATIDQAILDKPLTREDVFGYRKPGSLGPHDFPGDERTPSTLTTATSADGALSRFVIQVASAAQPGTYPRVTIHASDHSTLAGAKAELEITVYNADDTTTTAREVEQDAIRSIAVGKPSLQAVKAQIYRLGLADLRPWRPVVLFGPTRIVIEVGGPPQGISDDGNTVIHSFTAGTPVDRALKVTGAVRAFEASYVWRVKDDPRGQVLANGHGTASIGTSPAWGAYEFDVSLPSTVSGNIKLEVLQISPKDGSEISIASIPLWVR